LREGRPRSPLRHHTAEDASAGCAAYASPVLPCACYGIQRLGVDLTPAASWGTICAGEIKGDNAMTVREDRLVTGVRRFGAVRANVYWGHNSTPRRFTSECSFPPRFYSHANLGVRRGCVDHIRFVDLSTDRRAGEPLDSASRVSTPNGHASRRTEPSSRFHLALTLVCGIIHIREYSMK
jgi:hypothetical protein